MNGLKFSLLALALGLILSGAGPAEAFSEVQLSKEELKQLERFEAHLLKKANEAYRKKQYRQAAANYEAFVLEFSRSRAIPFALLRKARCLHLEDKRFAAIEAYTEVLDYFPDSVKYAGAALYYTGLAHWQNGDVQPAMKAWAEMADDVDYSKHPLAADGINRLAGYMDEQEKTSRAVELWRQVAVDFRRSNSDAAYEALKKVRAYYTRTKPDESALRALYQDAKSFERHPRKEIPEDLTSDRRYWDQLRSSVWHHGDFKDLQQKEKQAYYGYWAEQLAGKFPAWDEHQIHRIHFLRRAGESTEKWIQRLDEQFQAYQEDGDYQRIIRWIELLAEHPAKVEAYYQKLNFAKMNNDEIRDLFFTLWDKVENKALARSTFEKLRLDKMSDDQKRGQLFNHLRNRSVELTEKVLKTFGDQARAQRLRLALYWQHRMVEPGLEVAEALASSPEYASDAVWIKAHLLEHAKRYEEAVQAYRDADRPPHSLFKIAHCYSQLGKLEQAVGTLREIENFFGDHKKHGDAAPRAAMQIAHLYEQAGQRDRQIASLRMVMKKYPKSGQSSHAHNKLESLGVKTGGGIDVE